MTSGGNGDGGGGGGGSGDTPMLSDPSVYIQRAKKLRIEKEKKRRHEHDHGKNPHSPTLQRVGVQKKKGKIMYFPIGSHGVRDWSRRCSLKAAVARFKDTVSAYALEYDHMKGAATCRTLNKDGVRGTYTLVDAKSTVVYLRSESGFK